MKPIFQNLIFLTFILMLVGCAASYRPIVPPSVNYSSHELVDNISLSYQYDVLKYGDNKKYARKEQKSGLKLIAVKITNNSDTTITMGVDAFFYAGDNKIVPVEPIIIKRELGQNVPSYLFYMLFSFVKYQEAINGEVTKSVPIGLFIGPPLTIGNMMLASSANKNFYSELLNYNTNQRIINSGETIYGLVGLDNFYYSPLSIRK